MERLNFETASQKLVIKHVAGNLRIKGWNEDEFRADADSEDALKVIEEKDGTINVSCDTSCLIRIPTDSSLEIDKVNGDLAIKTIENKISVKHVAGDVVIKNVGDVYLGTVNGDISVKMVEGDLTIDNVNGSANIRDVEGALTLKKVNGGISLKGIFYSMDVATNGQASLKFEPEGGGTYNVTADGSIYCKLAPGASAKVTLKSKAEAIRVRTSAGRETFKKKKYELMIDDGENTINLTASGDINFIANSESDDFRIGAEFDLIGLSSLADEITQQVTEQIESQIGNITAQIGDISRNIPAEFRNDERLQRKMEAQQRKLSYKLNMAQRKLDRSMERLHHKTGGRAKSDPVTDEERITILNMVSDKKISIDEAEMLLAALEGRAPETTPPTPPDPPTPPTPPKSKVKSKTKSKSKSKSKTKNKPDKKE